jgi:serine-type D-Ala-D-Ala carboxypeptidase/endopeptidase (penicillin-binding protein 4)
VEGSWKKGGSRTFFLPVWQMNDWVKNLFAQALRERGIRLLPADDGAGVDQQLAFHSPPLSELLKPFNKNSINVMGDAFLKTLAIHHSGNPSLLDGGLTVLHSYLQSLGMEGFSIYDGSGLSRLSRVTPQAMLIFLHRALERNFEPLWDSLAIAGLDGTLRNRMKNTAATGTLRAKTGTLDGVYNLAGYVPWGQGFIPFVMLTKTSSANSAVARAAEDRVGVRLAELVGARAVSGIKPFPYVPEHAGFDDQ